MSKPRRTGIGEEYPHTDEVILITGVIFISVWILDTFLLSFSTFLNLFIHIIIRILIFLFLFIITLFFGIKSHNMIFKTAIDEQKLISSGVYSLNRHPLYFSILTFYLALIALSISLISIFIWLLIFFTFNKFALYEEEDLERIFGDEYKEYKNKVPRWISRFA